MCKTHRHAGEQWLDMHAVAMPLHCPGRQLRNVRERPAQPFDSMLQVARRLLPGVPHIAGQVPCSGLHVLQRVAGLRPLCHRHDVAVCDPVGRSLGHASKFACRTAGCMKEQLRN